MLLEKIKEFTAKYQTFVIVGVLVVAALAYWGISAYRQTAYYDNLAKELSADEGSENDVMQAQSAADKYISTFSHVVSIKVSDGGFEPAAVSVKPQTKLVFTGDDLNKHFLAVAPGSKTPKYFDPQIYLTNQTMFQTKVEDAGVYSFFDRENPQSSLVVTVTK